MYGRPDSRMLLRLSEMLLRESPSVLCHFDGLRRKDEKIEDQHGFPNQEAAVLSRAQSAAAMPFPLFGD